MTPIRCLALSKHFRGVRAVDGLDLEVPKGSIFGLVGPNGAGKTTALKTMMNILPADGGRAEILGTNSRRLGPGEFARIGYVSENQKMPEWMTIDYLMSYLRPFYPGWDSARAAELVRQFDLPPNRKLGHLSRGMLMKAAFASSLAYRPELLVLDEPFSGLDPLIREDLIQGILASAEETTILISSHDLAEIESFASHIGFMDGGRLRFSEEMVSLQQRFREIEVTFDVPQAPVANEVWPPHWLGAEVSPVVVRFVETRFHPEQTTENVRRMFAQVRNISVSPMPLRSIFLTLARSSSKVA
ncbi:MAG TPA: ABC transporter ATP-binding protein [Bryobacteraceae bacterium]|jgi:ABC-2 type transport system ATP-binding protein